MPPKRALLLINRHSRSGTDGAEEAERLLKSHGLALIVEHIENLQMIQEAIGRHAGQVDCVIVGGGDGSLNAAAGQLLAHKLPMGILPLGTANDLARTLDIPSSLQEAAAIIAQGLTRRVDLGCVNGVYFFNVANIGLGVNVKHALSSESKKRWGALSYVMGVISALRRHRPFRAKITCDDKRLVMRAIQIGVGNGRFYGGGMVVAEDASIQDNMFSVYALKPASFWALVAIVPAFKAGRLHSVEPAITLRGRKVRIETHRPMQISTDGEVRTMTPADFSILAAALEVYAPAVSSIKEYSGNADQE